MRTHRFGIAAAGVIAIAALAAGVAAAATSAGTATAVPFKPSTQAPQSSGSTATSPTSPRTAWARGTPLGVSTITGKGKGDSSVQPCVPFTGTGALVRHRQDQAHVQDRAALERLRRRGRPGLQHQREGHGHQGLRKARERPRQAQDHRRLRPGQGHVHGQVRRNTDQVARTPSSTKGAPHENVPILIAASRRHGGAAGGRKRPGDTVSFAEGAGGLRRRADGDDPARDDHAGRARRHRRLPRVRGRRQDPQGDRRQGRQVLLRQDRRTSRTSS